MEVEYSSREDRMENEKENLFLCLGVPPSSCQWSGLSFPVREKNKPLDPFKHRNSFL
jgi:hypothetical protein